MAKSIKQLAAICGVSEQAIRKWCARNQVAKDVAKHYDISETEETAILLHYGKTVRNQVAKHSETSFATDETKNNLIEMLKNELEVKNKQIEQLNNLIVQLNNQVAQLTAALENTTSALTAAQALHAADKKQLLIEGDAEVSERRHWWQRKKK